MYGNIEYYRNSMWGGRVRGDKSQEGRAEINSSGSGVIYKSSDIELLREIYHGGGKRCSIADCNKFAKTGGKCVSHGCGKVQYC